MSLVTLIIHWRPGDVSRGGGRVWCGEDGVECRRNLRTALGGGNRMFCFCKLQEPRITCSERVHRAAAFRTNSSNENSRMRIYRIPRRECDRWVDGVSQRTLHIQVTLQMKMFRRNSTATICIK